MGYSHILFVDEAGDDKAERLKPVHPSGNSEWFCLGGYLVRSSSEEEIEERRDSILLEIGGCAGGVLHYRNYNRRNRERVCRKLASYSARAFVVCSFKQTWVGYSNPRAAAASQATNVLFNFVARLLLERVTQFVAEDAMEKGIPEPVLRIVFANRKGHRFGHFKAYVLQLTRQARAGTTYLNTKEVDPSVLRYNEVDRAPASKLPGLQLADAVVSSVFQSIEQSSPHYEQKNGLLLRRIVPARRQVSWGKKRRDDFGVTLYPASKAFPLLTNDQKAFFEFFDYDFSWLTK